MSQSGLQREERICFNNVLQHPFLVSGFWFLSVAAGVRERLFLAMSVVVKPAVEKTGRFRRFSGEKLLDRSMVLRAYLLIIAVALTQWRTPLIVFPIFLIHPKVSERWQISDIWVSERPNHYV